MIYWLLAAPITQFAVLWYAEGSLDLSCLEAGGGCRGGIGRRRELMYQKRGGAVRVSDPIYVHIYMCVCVCVSASILLFAISSPSKFIHPPLNTPGLSDLLALADLYVTKASASSTLRHPQPLCLVSQHQPSPPSADNEINAKLSPSLRA